MAARTLIDMYGPAYYPAMGPEFVPPPQRNDVPLQHRYPMLRPADPAADTFDARFGAWDDIQQLLQLQRQQGVPIRPGTQERFGDPTKVISGYPTLQMMARR